MSSIDEESGLKRAENMALSKHTHSDVLTIDISRLASVSELKAYGALGPVTRIVERQTGLSLASQQWESLFESLSKVRRAVSDHRDALERFSAVERLKAAGRFAQTKSSISEILGFQLKARGWDELACVVKRLLAIDCAGSSLSKAQLFEKYKRDSFIASSRLEGIDIHVVKSKLSMEELIRQHKAGVKNG